MNTETGQSKTHFTVRRSERAKKRVKLILLLFLPVVILNPLLIWFLLRDLMMTLLFVIASVMAIVASVFLLASMARAEVQVKDAGIYQKSLFSKKTFSFHDIKRAVITKNDKTDATSFYSEQGKVLFAIPNGDDGYDLFMNALADRNIPVTRSR